MCENRTFDMALSCKCLQIPLWSLCGQHIPRTESRVGGRKGTVKLFMNRISSFSAEVHEGASGAVGGGRGGVVSPRKRGHRGRHTEPDAPRLGGGRARRAQPPPLPARRAFLALLGLGRAIALGCAKGNQSFKRKVNPSQWSSYKTASPFPIPRTN